MEAYLGTVLIRFAHVLFGILWIGLLYYFNFVQGGYFKQATPEALADANLSWHQVHFGGSAGAPCLLLFLG